MYKKVAMGFVCFKCDYTTSRKCNYDKHLTTAKHQSCINVAKKVAMNYCCLECDYNTSNRCNYNKHLLTAKHCATLKVAKLELQNKTVLVKQHNPNVEQNYDFVVELLKQNNELQKQIIEMSKEPMTVNNNNNTTNNNQFNISMFLNETCKNAINFSEFIDNIQITYDDLENNAKMGFVNGMTKIIIDNLKQLEIKNRPIHCTDIKRETIYVKEDQWEKDSSKDVIQKGIQEITRKNMCQLSEWREENPEYNDSIDGELGEKSIAMQQNSMAGTKREEYYPKIIKNIAKEFTIDKNKLLDN